MPALRLLVVAGPYEADRMRKVAAAAGAVAISAEPHDDFGRMMETVRPDAVIVAAGAFLRDPLVTIRRIRAGAMVQTPLIFVGEAAETLIVGAFVEEALTRPVAPEALVSRAISLVLGSASPLVAAHTDTAAPRSGDALQRVAASIDEALDTEMLSALRTVALPRHPEPPPASSASDGLLMPDALDAAVADLFGGLTGPALALPGQAALAGELADQDVPALLGRLYVDGQTGRLSLRRAGIEKAVYFEAGRAVFASSNSPEDRLVEMLVREGRLDVAQYQTAIGAAQETGRRMGALLIDLGLLKSTELLPAIRRHYEEVIASLCSWTTGRWWFQPGVMASPKQSRLLKHPAAIARDGLQRGYAGDRLWARLGSPRNVFRMEPRAGAAEVIAAVVVDEDERRVPLLFDGVRSVDEVVRASGLPAMAVGEIALTLWLFDLLHPASGESPTGSIRGEFRDLDIERERIAARHALVMDGDYFQILGVARGASAHEVRRAYERLNAMLDTAAIGPQLVRELATEILAIREVSQEALRVLGSATLRAQYQSGLARDAQQ